MVKHKYDILDIARFYSKVDVGKRDDCWLINGTVPTIDGYGTFSINGKSIRAHRFSYEVFHGGSGSSVEEIREANSYGSIKMNIDTDMQWAMWEGILNYYKKNEGYLQSQLGNPEGADSPNKKYYDPRVWLRKGGENFVKRLELAFDMLNAVNRN